MLPDPNAPPIDHFTVVGGIASWKAGGGRKAPDLTRAKFTDGAAGVRPNRKVGSVADMFSGDAEPAEAPSPPRPPSSQGASKRSQLFPGNEGDDDECLPLEHFTVAVGLTGAPVRTEKVAGGRRRFEGANNVCSHEEQQWRPGRRAPPSKPDVPLGGGGSGRRTAPAQSLVTHVGAALQDPAPRPEARTPAPGVPMAPSAAAPWSRQGDAPPLDRASAAACGMGVRGVSSRSLNRRG